MSAHISLRFLIFPNGNEFSIQFPIDSTFAHIKRQVFEQWPFRTTIPLTDVEVIRLIHSGKIIQNTQSLTDIFKLSQPPTPEELSQTFTVHIALKQTNRRPITPPEQSPSASTKTQETIEIDYQIHFHGCLVDEEEARMIADVFDRKKGVDNLIGFQDVVRFLRTYWRWMTNNNYKQASDTFPLQEVNRLKERVVGQGKERISCDEFRQIFFLFDNDAATSTCPYGELHRAQRATEELHKCLRPGEQFEENHFREVFHMLDQDRDGVLTCQELELLYYIYGVHVVCE